ncbi:SDR family oxidoreductase [Phormidium tenue]|jgi:NAD(P)-dependent dehydrogenase (short-subunit alcohol dehydrogenase family)|uniref:SDR family oxidoreductase n=1 Tax=Phormidium tenue FACHB-1050 TaxID=2692857 RepID=A0ABR8CAR9_9CYAN|nr:SDR family oxidoreductase [Phormidium tenue]MBD2317451.1 SDR family oxidoreductase [Phormidium tenue FACHB-1050]
MTKTIFITGASSGIGRATALYFQKQGWNVVATMRSPDKETDRADSLAKLDRLICLKLDVTDHQTIIDAVAETIARFGAIDVLVNNAGYGMLGAFETSTPTQIQRQFETNVFGLMETTRAVLPHFRDRKQGVIVNVASIGGRVAFPLYSLYHSTKWAVEGFSESLQHELLAFNIRVKIIEPGPIKTDFYERSAERTSNPDFPAYDKFSDRILTKLNQIGTTGALPEVVAKTIYKASTDNSWKLRYPADPIAKQLLFIRKLLPDFLFTKIVRHSTNV